MSAEPIIRVRDLRYRYPGSDQDVLRIPFMDVSGVGLTALTGPSGVGKSTLIELLAGTIREDYEGSLRVLGKEWKDLTKDAERQRQLRRIGLIPQDFGLLGSRTPRETLTQDLSDSGVPAMERRVRVERALGEVDLSGFSDRQVSGLSGGQRQRVAIARMLARDVDLVIADEPTANLDPELVAGVMSLFRELGRRVPVVLVTHDPRVSEQSDRTIVLQSSVAAPSARIGTPAPQSTIRRRAIRIGLAVIVCLGLIGGGIAFAAFTRTHQTATRTSPPASSVGNLAPTGQTLSPSGLVPTPPVATTSPTSTGPPSTTALHDYLWSAYNLMQQSAQQRLQVKAAIRAKDAATLATLQETRRQLLNTVEGWQVPIEAQAANRTLEQALQFSIISDGNWSNYAAGNLSYDEAVAYDTEFTHPAKHRFVDLYNRLCAGVPDSPPTESSDFLF
jgi:ABC-type lipoprotein export system ATPase subunit